MEPKGKLEIPDFKERAKDFVARLGLRKAEDRIEAEAKLEVEYKVNWLITELIITRMKADEAHEVVTEWKRPTKIIIAGLAILFAAFCGALSDRAVRFLDQRQEKPQHMEQIKLSPQGKQNGRSEFNRSGVD